MVPTGSLCLQRHAISAIGFRPAEPTLPSATRASRGSARDVQTSVVASYTNTLAGLGNKPENAYTRLPLTATDVPCADAMGAAITVVHESVKVSHASVMPYFAGGPGTKLPT